jgi:hypothetical protein
MQVHSSPSVLCLGRMHRSVGHHRALWMHRHVWRWYISIEMVRSAVHVYTYMPLVKVMVIGTPG